MNVKKVDGRSFTGEVLNSDLPVVVDFYADWCRPCRQVAEAIQSLARKWDGHVRVAKVDIDESPELAETYGIFSIPSIVLFERGTMRASSVGAKPAGAIERELGLEGAARRVDRKRTA